VVEEGRLKWTTSDGLYLTLISSSYPPTSSSYSTAYAAYGSYPAAYSGYAYPQQYSSTYPASGSSSTTASSSRYPPSTGSTDRYASGSSSAPAPASASASTSTARYPAPPPPAAAPPSTDRYSSTRSEPPRESRDERDRYESRDSSRSGDIDRYESGRYSESSRYGSSSSSYGGSSSYGSSSTSSYGSRGSYSSSRDSGYRSSDRDYRGGGGSSYAPDEPTDEYTQATFSVQEKVVDETNEADVFSEIHNTGINFSKYENIPVSVTGSDAPPCLNTFEEAKFHSYIMENVLRAKYTVPTPVQKHSFAIVGAGRDLMACAQTGSGKTAAFLLPTINRLLAAGAYARPSRGGRQTPEVLVVAPTRELAMQVWNLWFSDTHLLDTCRGS
jgi:hypothetical protein